MLGKEVLFHSYMILNSRFYILNKGFLYVFTFLFLSLFIDRLFYYDNFGVFYKDTLVYLTTDPERDVVKQKIDDPLNVPRHLPKTKIPNQHAGIQIIGVHVGHYFWIFGGKSWHTLASHDLLYSGYSKVHIKSSLWSLNRDVWINGPEIPEGLIKYSPCATAINDTFAIIININSYTDSIPIQGYDFSKGVWHPMSKPPIKIPTSQFSLGPVEVPPS